MLMLMLLLGEIGWQMLMLLTLLLVGVFSSLLQNYKGNHPNDMSGKRSILIVEVKVGTMSDS